MIGTIILLIFNLLLSGIVAILPAGESLPSVISEAIQFFTPFWSKWSNLLPLNEALIIIALVIALESALFVFGLGDWTYRKIRG